MTQVYFGPALSIHAEVWKAIRRAKSIKGTHVVRPHKGRWGHPMLNGRAIRSETEIAMRRNASHRARKMKITLPHVSIQDRPL